MTATVCRLCLQTISNNHFETIKESMMKVLKLNLTVSDEAVMCVDCASCLQVFSRFRSGCVILGEGTLPLSESQNGVKLEAVETSVETEPASNLQSLIKIEIECSFCKETHGREELIPLNESKDNMIMVKLLEQYITETILNNTEELLTCTSCLEALQGVLGVVLKCSEVEEMIREYIELEGTDDKGRIQLKEVQKFMSKPKVKLEIDSLGMGDLEGICDQIKEEITTMTELELKYEKEISHPELIIKTDDNIKSDESNCDTMDTKSEKICCDRFQEPFIENKTPSDLPRTPVVTSETGKCNVHLNQHLLTHKISSETKMFHYEICSNDTENKNSWKKHLLTHRNTSEMFECDYCSHKAKLESHVKTHLLIHKSPSELKMFKCKLCPYETNRKGHLERHLLTHKTASELKMCKCELCPYEAKHKDRLRKHLLIHKCPSELKMFKCELCSFETKRNGSLKTHLLTHKTPSEIKMFKCELCSHETKQKRYLRIHLLTHKSPS